MTWSARSPAAAAWRCANGGNCRTSGRALPALKTSGGLPASTPYLLRDRLLTLVRPHDRARVDPDESPAVCLDFWALRDRGLSRVQATRRSGVVPDSAGTLADARAAPNQHSPLTTRFVSAT